MAANPHVQKLPLEPWAALYERPFVGVTTDGNPVTGLYSRRPKWRAARSDDQRRSVTMPTPCRWSNARHCCSRSRRATGGDGTTQRSTSINTGCASRSSPRRPAKACSRWCGQVSVRADMKRRAMSCGSPRSWASFSATPKCSVSSATTSSIFALPSTTEPWGWQLMGHHLAPNCAVIDGQLVLSPTFMGAEPNFADTGPFAHVHLFQDEENRGLALIRAPSPDPAAAGHRQPLDSRQGSTDRPLASGRSPAPWRRAPGQSHHSLRGDPGSGAVVRSAPAVARTDCRVR